MLSSESKAHYDATLQGRISCYTSLDSCKISQVSILIIKRIARGTPRFLSRNFGLLTENFENLCFRAGMCNKRPVVHNPGPKPLSVALANTLIFPHHAWRS